jgi:hypothetical protein
VGAPCSQVAHFQALLFTVCDLCITLLLTFASSDVPCLGCLWAAAAAVFEANQVVRASRHQSLTERVGSLQACT